LARKSDEQWLDLLFIDDDSGKLVILSTNMLCVIFFCDSLLKIFDKMPLLNEFNSVLFDVMCSCCRRKPSMVTC